MTKELEIKQKAVEYGFDEELINSLEVEFTTEGYGWTTKLGKYLPLQKKIVLFDDSIESIFPTYLHEVTHALQNIEMEKRYGKVIGCLLYWLSLTFLRSKIETDAEEIEDRIYAHREHEAAQPRI